MNTPKKAFLSLFTHFRASDIFSGKPSVTFLFLDFHRCAKLPKKVINRFREKLVKDTRVDGLTNRRNDMHEFIGPPLPGVQKSFCFRETFNGRCSPSSTLRFFYICQNLINMGNKYVKVVFVFLLLKISNTLKLSDLFTLKT